MSAKKERHSTRGTEVEAKRSGPTLPKSESTTWTPPKANPSPEFLRQMAEMKATLLQSTNEPRTSNQQNEGKEATPSNSLHL